MTRPLQPSGSSGSAVNLLKQQQALDGRLLAAFKLKLYLTCCKVYYIYTGAATTTVLGAFCNRSKCSTVNRKACASGASGTHGSDVAASFLLQIETSLG